MNYYTAQSVGKNMIAIASRTGEYLYLIEGSDRALLVDASTGVANLPDFVQQLTSKPLTVVLTHGHVDHAPGAAGFHTVYLHPADLPLYRRHCAERDDYVNGNLGSAAEELTKADFAPVDPDKALMPLQDGMVFDLGSIHVEVIALPGHTKGTVVLLVQEPRLLILGDACNNSTFLFDEFSTTVQTYRATLAAAKGKLLGRFDRVFFSHRSIEGEPDVMDNVLALCDALLAGQGDAQPYTFRGQQVFIAKACAAHFVRPDGKCGNLVYSQSKIY